MNLFGEASHPSIAAAARLVNDPWAPARAYSAEHPEFKASWEADAAFTVGYLSSTIGAMLDVMGYPRQGPARPSGAPANQKGQQ